VKNWLWKWLWICRKDSQWNEYIAICHNSVSASKAKKLFSVTKSNQLMILRKRVTVYE